MSVEEAHRTIEEGAVHTQDRRVGGDDHARAAVGVDGGAQSRRVARKQGAHVNLHFFLVLSAIKLWYFGWRSVAKILSQMRPVLTSYTAFQTAVQHGALTTASILPDATVRYAADGVDHVTQLVPMQVTDVARDLVAHHVDLAFVPPSGAAMLLKPLLDLFPLAMLAFVILSVLGRGPGKTLAAKAPALVENVDTRFADVAGLTAAKEELREVVDFLRAPQRFAATGARPPKGVLLEGPPGTGKTLLARAVAGEAGVAFLPVTASSFVEMYVGVGAARVRALVDDAKAAAPCIVWIDEIDAVAKQRSQSGGTAGNEERETTLNEMLSALDGFEQATGVVVMAATNRADMLDDALVRPGRFDRRIPVTLPDVGERADILAVHARDKTLGAAVDLDVVARRTSGFSGAALANLMNEAAIRAVRRNDTTVSADDVASALDRVVGGLAKPTPMDERTRLLVAVHEAGHALVGTLLDEYDAVDRVSIVPRTSGLGGFTAFVPDETRAVGGIYTREYLEAQLAVLLAGRAAEEIVLGATTTGATSDLERVYALARQMVVDFGFGASLVANDDPQGQAADAVDKEIEALVDAAHARALTVLNAHHKTLVAFAHALAEEETMDGDRVRE